MLSIVGHGCLGGRIASTCPVVDAGAMVITIMARVVSRGRTCCINICGIPLKLRWGAVYAGAHQRYEMAMAGDVRLCQAVVRSFTYCD